MVGLKFNLFGKERGSELLASTPGPIAVAGFDAQQIAVPIGTVCGVNDLRNLFVQSMTVVSTDVLWSGWVDVYTGRSFEPRVQGLSGVVLGVPNYVSEQSSLTPVGGKGSPMLLVPVRTAVPDGQALAADVMRPKAWEALMHVPIMFTTLDRFVRVLQATTRELEPSSFTAGGEPLATTAVASPAWTSWLCEPDECISL